MTDMIADVPCYRNVWHSIGIARLELGAKSSTTKSTGDGDNSYSQYPFEGNSVTLSSLVYFPEKEKATL